VRLGLVRSVYAACPCGSPVDRVENTKCATRLRVCIRSRSGSGSVPSCRGCNCVALWHYFNSFRVSDVLHRHSLKAADVFIVHGSQLKLMWRCPSTLFLVSRVSWVAGHVATPMRQRRFHEPVPQCVAELARQRRVQDDATLLYFLLLLMVFLVRFRIRCSAGCTSDCSTLHDLSAFARPSRGSKATRNEATVGDVGQ
jgi:hypothetical protein